MNEIFYKYLNGDLVDKMNQALDKVEKYGIDNFEQAAACMSIPEGYYCHLKVVRNDDPNGNPLFVYFITDPNMLLKMKGQLKQQCIDNNASVQIDLQPKKFASSGEKMLKDLGLITKDSRRKEDEIPIESQRIVIRVHGMHDLETGRVDERLIYSFMHCIQTLGAQTLGLLPAGNEVSIVATAFDVDKFNKLNRMSKNLYSIDEDRTYSPLCIESSDSISYQKWDKIISPLKDENGEINEPKYFFSIILDTPTANNGGSTFYYNPEFSSWKLIAPDGSLDIDVNDYNCILKLNINNQWVEVQFTMPKDALKPYSGVNDLNEMINLDNGISIFFNYTHADVQ